MSGQIKNITEIFKTGFRVCNKFFVLQVVDSRGIKSPFDRFNAAAIGKEILHTNLQRGAGSKAQRADDIIRAPDDMDEFDFGVHQPLQSFQEERMDRHSVGECSSHFITDDLQFLEPALPLVRNVVGISLTRSTGCGTTARSRRLALATGQ